MRTKIILTEKDIKRAIEEYLLSKGQGTVKAIRLEPGDKDTNKEISADPREYSNFYAEVEIETEVISIE